MITYLYSLVDVLFKLKSLLFLASSQTLIKSVSCFQAVTAEWLMRKRKKKSLASEFPLWSSSHTVFYPSGFLAPFSPPAPPLTGCLCGFICDAVSCLFVPVASLQRLFSFTADSDVYLYTFMSVGLKTNTQSHTSLTSSKQNSNDNSPSTLVTLLTWSCHTSYKGRRRRSSAIRSLEACLCFLITL